MSRCAAMGEGEILCLATVAGPLMQIREETEKSFTIQPFYANHRRFLRQLKHAGAETGFGTCSDEAKLLVDSFIKLAMEEQVLFQKSGDEKFYFEYGFVRWCRINILDRIDPHTRSLIEDNLLKFYKGYSKDTEVVPLILDDSFPRGSLHLARA